MRPERGKEIPHLSAIQVSDIEVAQGHILVAPADQMPETAFDRFFTSRVAILTA
jgi:hypothetical protein